MNAANGRIFYLACIILQNYIRLLGYNQLRQKNMKKLLIISSLFPYLAMAQPLKIRNQQGGIFSLGVRSTVSTFNGGDFGNTGFGAGGQFRLQLANRVNTDWYFDYLTSNVGDFARRIDYHIGWSVLCYFTDKPNPPVKPYVLAGHCFDWTELTDVGDATNSALRRSSAVQAGAGFHINLSERMDMSFVGQYMIHLGSDIHAERTEAGEVVFEKHGAGLEGHLLFHVGINYKIADLW